MLPSCGISIGYNRVPGYRGPVWGLSWWPSPCHLCDPSCAQRVMLFFLVVNACPARGCYISENDHITILAKVLQGWGTGDLESLMMCIVGSLAVKKNTRQLVGLGCPPRAALGWSSLFSWTQSLQLSIFHYARALATKEFVCSDLLPPWCWFKFTRSSFFFPDGPLVAIKTWTDWQPMRMSAFM